MHESYDRKDALKPGSNRNFGLVFTVFFLIVGFFPLLGGHPIRLWSLYVSAVLLIISFAYPKIFTPMNILWFKFGLLLHRIVNPVILTILFFVVITPVALLARLVGKSFFPLGKDEKLKTYWITRDQNNPGSMKDQF